MQDRITQINEILLHCTAGPYIGSFASIHDGSVYVRFTPDSGSENAGACKRPQKTCNTQISRHFRFLLCA